MCSFLILLLKIKWWYKLILMCKLLLPFSQKSILATDQYAQEHFNFSVFSPLLESSWANDSSLQLLPHHLQFGFRSIFLKTKNRKIRSKIKIIVKSTHIAFYSQSGCTNCLWWLHLSAQNLLTEVKKKMNGIINCNIKKKKVIKPLALVMTPLLCWDWQISKENNE